MACCATTKKQLMSVQKESKFWKDRYFLEKKCRNTLAHWILGVFGFTVKVECDRLTNGIKVEGRESKEAVGQAIAPSAGGEDKVFMMEDGMNPEDFLEDPEDLQNLAIAIEEDSQDAQPHIANSASTTQLQMQDGTPIELAGSGVGQGSEILYLGNYDDHNGGQQSSYIILKNSDNEDIPVQLDYSEFINGDIHQNRNFAENRQILYRIASPLESVNISSSLSEAVHGGVASVTLSPPKPPNSTTKKKATPQIPKTKATKLTKVTQKSPVPAKLSKLSSGKAITSGSGQKRDSGSTIPRKTPTNNEDKEFVNNTKSPLEFGLTMREKAEIYVRTKAQGAVRKVGTGYTCTICSNSYSYSSIDNAVTHTKSHFDMKPYKCTFCEESFSIQKDFLQHKKLHNPKVNKSASPLVNNVLKSQSKLNQAPNATPGSPRNANSNTPTTLPISPFKPSESQSPTATNPVKIVPANGKNTMVLPKEVNKNKQFKCQISGCEWSYATAEELGWHMKAHSQSRV